MNITLFIMVSFIKAKWVFKKPVQKKYLIYDAANSEILFKYINKKNSEIYHVRWEVINFYVIYKTLIIYGFKNIKENYKKVYFNFVRPSIAITLINSNDAFYKLKYFFPNIITIAIQNSVRNEDHFSLLKRKKKEKLYCDYLFCFSKSYGSQYKKFIDMKKFITIGSFINNHYSYKNTEKKNILFISKCKKNQTVINEIIILKKLIKYIKKNNTNKIDICLKTKDISIVNYFNKFLEKNKINLITHSAKKSHSYKLMSEYKTIVFTDSTLGYECMAKNKKVISFSLGSLNKSWCVKNELIPIMRFGYPNRLSNSGFCWSNEFNSKNHEKLFNNVTNLSKNSWNKKMYSIKNKIIYFDPKNKIFSKFLKKIKTQNNSVNF